MNVSAKGQRRQNLRKLTLSPFVSFKNRAVEEDLC
jgi:hypothetical protein